MHPVRPAPAGLGKSCICPAQALVAAGASRTVDLARVNGRNYCTVGAVGFDAEVIRYVDLMKGPLWGQPAYFYAVLRTLGRYRPPQVRLTWDHGHYHGPLFLAAGATPPAWRLCPRPSG